MMKLPVVVPSLLLGAVFGGSVVLAQPMPPSKPAAPATSPAPAAAAHAGTIQGNKKSKVYHLPQCPGFGKIKAGNLVAFTTEEEATKAGYHKAKNCK